MKLAIPLHCTSCNKVWDSAFSSLLLSTGGGSLVGNTEACPDCGSRTTFPDGSIVSTRNGPRFLPASATLTPSYRPHRQLSPNEVVLTIGNPEPRSITWKMWKAGKEIYIAAREFPQWKLSLHKSGHAHIGFTSEYHRKSVAAQNAPRHFKTSYRTVPYAAHGHRIARFSVKSSFGIDQPLLRPIKTKKNRDIVTLKLPEIIPDTIVFELYYTEGHPQSFVETEGLSMHAIALMKGHGEEHFSLVPELNDSKSVEELKSYTQLRADFSCAGASDAIITFGVSTKNTYLIELSHP